MSQLGLVSLPRAAKLAGKAAWSARAVLRLLTNPTYAGHRPDGAPGRHARIVSAELFSKVQALIDGRRTRAPTKPSERDADEQKAIELFNPFVLRGLLTCGTCGKTMAPSMSEALRPNRPRFAEVLLQRAPGLRLRAGLLRVKDDAEVGTRRLRQRERLAPAAKERQGQVREVEEHESKCFTQTEQHRL
jgi:Recombinase